MKITFLSVDSCVYMEGVRSVSAVLRSRGHITKIIFLPLTTHSYSQQTLCDINQLVDDSDLVGISFYSYTYSGAVQVTASIKKTFPNKMVIWGGVHASTNPRDALQYADLVCVGEGEDVMLKLAESPYASIEGIRRKGDDKTYGLRPLRRDLEQLPFRDYEFDHHKILNGDKIVSFEERYLFSDKLNAGFPRHVARGTKNSKPLIYYDTRGCVFSCSFCCNDEIKSLYEEHFIRRRTIPSMIAELEYIRMRVSSADSVFFAEDSFFSRDIKDLELFRKEYQRRINLPFSCYADPRHITEEKLNILKLAGLDKMFVGIQTGSEHINKNIYNRFCSNDVVLGASKLINKYNMNVEYQIICSNPYERERDLLDTIVLLKRLPKPYFLQVFSLSFFPGTKLNEIAKQDNLDTNISSRPLKNLYLDCVLRAMSGKVTELKYGYIPAFLLNVLVRYRIRNSIMKLISWFSLGNRFFLRS